MSHRCTLIVDVPDGPAGELVELALVEAGCTLVEWHDADLLAPRETHAPDCDLDDDCTCERTTPMNRAEAEQILAAREGTPPEHLDHCRTTDLIAAATAPAGQPCGDCGRLVVWHDETGWTHVEPSTCFLAGRPA